MDIFLYVGFLFRLKLLGIKDISLKFMDCNELLETKAKKSIKKKYVDKTETAKVAIEQPHFHPFRWAGTEVPGYAFVSELIMAAAS